MEALASVRGVLAFFGSGAGRICKSCVNVLLLEGVEAAVETHCCDSRLSPYRSSRSFCTSHTQWLPAAFALKHGCLQLKAAREMSCPRLRSSKQQAQVRRHRADAAELTLGGEAVRTSDPEAAGWLVRLQRLASWIRNARSSPAFETSADRRVQSSNLPAKGVGNVGCQRHSSPHSVIDLRLSPERPRHLPSGNLLRQLRRHGHCSHRTGCWASLQMPPNQKAQWSKTGLQLHWREAVQRRAGSNTKGPGAGASPSSTARTIPFRRQTTSSQVDCGRTAPGRQPSAGSWHDILFRRQEVAVVGVRENLHQQPCRQEGESRSKRRWWWMD